ncbi:MAG: radical SAM protein [Pleomorphochaeta sp.]
MNYEGKIYRPWPEANSLIIQVTTGCTHNKCTFCDMFREQKFHIKDINVIFDDIEESASLYKDYVESIFLVDGNVMVLNTEFLLKVINKINKSFPKLKRIALYSSFNDLRRKSVEDLKKLKKAGIEMVYVGLESGNDDILEFVKKGITPNQAIEGMKKAKEAEIKVLVSIIFGLGGKYKSKEHIKDTVELINIIKPDEIAPMALTLQPNTVLKQQADSKEFIQATPLQILEEEKYLIENIGSFKTYYWGDHGNNILTIRGYLPENKELFLTKINQNISNNPIVEDEILLTQPW